MRSNELRIRLTDEEAADLDARRGIASLSAYVRSVLWPDIVSVPVTPMTPPPVGQAIPTPMVTQSVAHEHHWRKRSDAVDYCDDCGETRRHQLGTRP